PGQAGDSPQMVPVLERIRVPQPGRGRPRSRPVRVLADKAYSSRANRAWLPARKIRATISQPSDQVNHRKRRGSSGGRPPAFDAEVYKRRNVVERGINLLKQYRGCATRYDKLGGALQCDGRGGLDPSLAETTFVTEPSSLECG